MGEYYFGLIKGRAKHQRRLESIARKHSADFHCVRDGGEWRSYFSCQNYGHPHDEATANAVYAELEAKGLWPVPVHER